MQFTLIVAPDQRMSVLISLIIILYHVDVYNVSNVITINKVHDDCNECNRFSASLITLSTFIGQINLEQSSNYFRIT